MSGSLFDRVADAPADMELLGREPTSAEERLRVLDGAVVRVGELMGRFVALGTAEELRLMEFVASLIHRVGMTLRFVKKHDATTDCERAEFLVKKEMVRLSLVAAATSFSARCQETWPHSAFEEYRQMPPSQPQFVADPRVMLLWACRTCRRTKLGPLVARYEEVIAAYDRLPHRGTSATMDMQACVATVDLIRDEIHALEDADFAAAAAVASASLDVGWYA